MKLHDRRPRRRGGFTLIELLVVIAIIAVLISLTAAAVFNAFNVMNETQVRTELSQLAVGVSQFESDFNLGSNRPPPSRLWLDKTGAYVPATYPGYAGLSAAARLEVPKVGADSKAYLHAVWPHLWERGPVDWNGDGRLTGNFVLEGQQSLVFFLGGARNANGAFIGFSAENASNPMAPTAKRKGPYFQFAMSRVQVAPNGFRQYLDPFDVKPYAYFSCGKAPNNYNAYPGLGSDCASLGVSPYYDTNAPRHYLHPDTFQIISAGRDKRFGPGGMWTAATAGAIAPDGRDDISNFYDRKLGIPK